MSEKKIINLGALILEAMTDEDTFMPYDHQNGVAIDTRDKVEENVTSVEGYWVAPDTGECYYIRAKVTVDPLEFTFCPEDEVW